MHLLVVFPKAQKELCFPFLTSFGITSGFALNWLFIAHYNHDILGLVSLSGTSVEVRMQGADIGMALMNATGLAISVLQQDFCHANRRSGFCSCHPRLLWGSSEGHGLSPRI